MPKKFSNTTKNEIRKTILDEYKKHLINNEASKISVDSLVKKANIAKGTFYFFFDNKEELFLEVTIEILTAIEKQIEQINRSSSNSSIFLFEVLLYLKHVAKEYPWVIKMTGKEFSSMLNKLSLEGKNQIYSKKERIWGKVFKSIADDLVVSKSIFQGLVSILLLSISDGDEITSFDEVYREFASMITNRSIREDK
ncbi:TetR/AcrR family transcriptional regulator [Oceanobacillus jeddahense]|uniref:TetR/AcrR family transcriptional regulator n=1 Tax=Oceanobacillus jeddahense TaxID=1462527 RepID=A0ABY5JWH9_9BACI|nr:TetR/AcrR family transcriptional regulator [Oceanobacillus jeddahense]UUI04743.1 TetR/AcrR family transcriptional regulator [Oceanobacillus jeddahense]